MTTSTSLKSAEHGAVTVRWTATGPVQENTLFVHDASGAGFVVDPGDEAPRLLQELRTLNLRPEAILLTHAHFDHVGAVQPLREALGIPVYLHAADLPLYRGAAASAARWNLKMTQPLDPDGVLTDGQIVEAGAVRLVTRELPGHSPGHVVFVGDGFVLAGDTLFEGSVGRTDLPGGDHAQLIAGIESRLLSLPGTTRVYPGHGRPTTVEHERTHNPYLTLP